MVTLRLTQSDAGKNRYRVEMALEGDGPRQTATAEFVFQMTDQDNRDLQWYLEDYLNNPHQPAPVIAARVEHRMEQLGYELFKNLFEGKERINRDTDRLWTRATGHLADLRIEVVATVKEASTIPWELLRDPLTREPLAVAAREFVRAHPNPVRRTTQAPQPREDSPIRILLVICRPRARNDVPFRSVARRLIMSLNDQTRAVYQLDVLRPPTFERLYYVLQRAYADGRPYHVVHFDGHGVFLDLEKTLKNLKEQPNDELKALAEFLDFDPQRFSPAGLYPHMPTPGTHGYLAFEDSQSPSNLRLVDGEELGQLLAGCRVPVLLLNACRSAHAEAADQPQVSEQPKADDSHLQVRAFGSLAQQAMDQGLSGVLAMRFNVYVVTAAQFVADLYAEMVRGRTLGQAATLGRKRLWQNPLRTIAHKSIPLQDWVVPAIYEAEPIRLFPEAKDKAGLQIKITAGQATVATGSFDPVLPKPPDAGFFGRDETLLAVDRAFDHQHVVLLHAFAGSGKTATAAEFAHWYAATGGLQGPVLFTSFEQHQPLVRILDRLGQVFGSLLERAGIHWLTLDDSELRKVALQVLAQVPVLWIWDNVEPVSGFPAGTPSSWSKAEQGELADFLRDCRATKAKFLLTSRRDERPWLGDLPCRISVGPMPMQEREQLSQALAEKHGRKITTLDDWRPLLRFTEGNPLTITVLVGQALRDGLQTRAQIEAFVEQLRRGEAKFDDAPNEGRTRSLGASLAYGFENAFTEPECHQLALLYFFQGFVSVQAFQAMVHYVADRCLIELWGLSREPEIVLLNRAAEVGILSALGGGYYCIHPALPWFFKGLFDKFFLSRTAVELATEANCPKAATQAFVEVMGKLGDSYHDQYGIGNSKVIASMGAEEANLLHARRLARQHEMWSQVISTMQGLRQLYFHTGRRLEWRRLVEEIVPDFIDSATEGPLPGRENSWSLVTEYRVRLAKEMRNWSEAERLQQIHIDGNRRWAEEVVAGLEGEVGKITTLAALPNLLRRVQSLAKERVRVNFTAVRQLAVSLHELGDLQLECQRPECVKNFMESMELVLAIGDRPGAAKVALNLGNAYKDLAAIRDLAQAERWYRESLDLCSETDAQGRAKCLGQIGCVTLARFDEAKATGEPPAKLVKYLNDALGAYHQSLGVLPEDAVDDLAVVHNQLGRVFHRAGKLDQAVLHYREAIRYREAAGNRFWAGIARRNVADLLFEFRKLLDAQAYAEAALRDFQSFGPGAAVDIERTQKFLVEINRQLKSS